MDPDQRRTVAWMAAHLEAQHRQELAAAVDAVFADLDLRELTATVIRHRQVGFIAAATALDDMFGDVPDPAADEDD